MRHLPMFTGPTMPLAPADSFSVSNCTRCAPQWLPPRDYNTGNPGSHEGASVTTDASAAKEAYLIESGSWVNGRLWVTSEVRDTPHTTQEILVVYGYKQNDRSPVQRSVRDLVAYLGLRFRTTRVSTMPAVGCETLTADPSTTYKTRWRRVVDKCAGHLVSRIAVIQPKLVVACGPEAARMLGITDKFRQVTDIHGALVQVDIAGELTWVLVAPSEAHLSVFPSYLTRIKDRISQVWEHIVRGEEVPFAWQYSPSTEVRVVDNYADALEAFADINAHEVNAWDIESFGRMWNREFRVLTMSFAPLGQEYAYTLTRAALDDPAVVQLARDYLTDATKKKVGQNVMYDENAVWVYWGIDVQGLIHDTLLSRRILDAGLKGSLDVLGTTVGIAGHKDEVSAEADKAYLAYRDAQQVPDEVEGDEDAEAWIAETMAQKGGKAKKESKSWSLAGVSPDVLARYNARDAYVTGKVADAHHTRLREEDNGCLMDVWRHTRRGHYAIRAVQRWGMPVSASRLAEAEDLTEAMSVAALLKAQALRSDVDESVLSSGKKLGDLLYRKMGLPVYDLTATGQPSTAAETLEKLRKDAPIVGAILDLRAARKVQSAYVRGTARAVRDDGRVHPSYHIGLARSGRMSVSDPPVHQIPRATEVLEDPGTIARSLFVADDGWKLVNVDLSQVELRVAAYLSRDAKMIDIFNQKGRDIHMEAAQLIAPVAWGVDWDTLTAVQKKEYRSIVKRFVFGLLYGMSTKRLAAETKQTEGQAEAIRSAILGEFRDLQAWTEARIRDTRRTQLVWSEWDGAPFRRRYVPESTSTSFKYVKHAENVAVNGPVQSLANDICLDALIRVVDYVQGELVGNAEVVMTIHDSIILHVRDPLVEEVAARVSREMTSRSDMLGVPLAAEAEYGQAWHAMTKLEAA